MHDLTPEGEHLIELAGVTKRYGQTVALSRVNLFADGGSITGLIGRNGAGKTTLIRLLAGLTEPDVGTVRVAQASPTDERPTVMRRCGFLTDDLALFSYLTVHETLQWLANAHGLVPEVGADRSRDLMRFFGLVEMCDRLTEDLSTGMKKRLAIAASMIHAPSILVLDEPFESLDPLMAWRLKELLKQYARSGGTVLVSSHLLDLVQEVCQRLYVLELGAIRVSGSTSDVLRQAETRLPRQTLEELYLSVVDYETDAGLQWLMRQVDDT